MTKNIYFYWNLLHFYFFVWHTNAHLIFNYINPIVYISKLPVIKNFYSKHGIDDINSFSNEKVFNEKKIGINSIWSGVQKGGMFIFIEYSFFNIVQGLSGKVFINILMENKFYFGILILIFLFIAGFFNYNVLFKNDKYLEYFNEFEKMTKTQKLKTGWLCFLVVLLLIMFLVFSFSFVPKV